MPVNRQWLLARRPSGPVGPGDFRWAESPIPSLGEGEILVRNLYLSCDPTQRGWMSVDTYLPAVKIGEVMRSFAVGEVAASRDPRFSPKELVQGLFGWQDYAAVRPGATSALSRIPPGVSIETAMGALGVTGITAYFGLLEVGRPQPGETVVVSGAAGATGSVAAQIAKIKGCRAVGIAGGPTKCRYLLDELGLDAAVDYKSEDVGKRLGETCPKGIDVYFDNVGGPILDAALDRLALRGRVVLCGAISRYNDTLPAAGPRNYLNLLVRRGRMEGFIVLDYFPRAAEAVEALAGWMRQGRLKERVDVQHGLENAPAALARLFHGANQGKQLVQIAEASGA
ncbi:MAG TPA: NADP-dependent oxidoreductase [Anaeromyxobacteraceae bacterium]|nr:NADP-dependent oxidoreductase [Anaeromyxobacteraceae bacterium]